MPFSQYPGIPHPGYVVLYGGCACFSGSAIRAGAPYIVDACDLPCAEEVFLHEPYGILYGTFTFRIMLIAYPQFQVLFSAEIIKDARPDDFAISFACHEYSILINDQLRGQQYVTPLYFVQLRIAGALLFCKKYIKRQENDK